MSKPRLTRLIAAFALALSGLLVIAGPASAQPGYGAGGITVSISSSVPGVSITITATGFRTGERVTVVVTGTNGRPVVNRLIADGSGTVSLTVPAQSLRPGSHRVIVVGRSGFGTATFRTGGSAVSNQGFTPANASSPLNTASNAVVPLSILGLLLAVGGGAAVVNNRRSRNRV